MPEFPSKSVCRWRKADNFRRSQALNFELQTNSAKLEFVQNYESNESTNFPPPPVREETILSDALPVSPDNPPWNSWAAIGIWLASIAFIIIFPLIFLIGYLVKIHFNLADGAALAEFAKTDATAVLLQVIAVIPAHIFTLLAAWLVVTRFNKFSFRETLGWRWNGFSIWTCIGIVGGFFILASVISYFVSEQDNEFLRMLKTSQAVVYVVAFLATFTAPLVEEVVYRGMLYSAFQKTLGVPAAVILATALFALVHVPQYWGSPSTIFLICLLSLVLTLVRVRTKNLLPCIALHTVFNGSQSLLLIFQPYVEEYMKNHQSQTGFFLHFFK
ncbi:MAG: CPBP family intramembrane metalloprotease [Acidobacteriota bacterium]|nr:CPBP family intramembrane metalloprotease [Acidobacteriota bacterium]